MKEKLPDWCDRVVDKQPGFMLYAGDWQEYATDYDSEEIGEMVKALLNVFLTGEATEFHDRGMRQFSYVKKCVENTYNRYKGIKGKEALPFEKWLDEEYKQRLTIVDDRQEPSPNVTKNNTNDQSPETNSQSPIINNQIPEFKHNDRNRAERENEKESVRGEPAGDPSTEELMAAWQEALSRGDNKEAYRLDSELFKRGIKVDPFSMRR